MSNDDDLAAEIEEAGRRAEDRVWHMPMAEEYHDQLKSNFADFANACGRDGGAITAACFLSKFTDGLRWAHVDIAGTAYVTGAQKAAPGGRCRCSSTSCSTALNVTGETKVDFYLLGAADPRARLNTAVASRRRPATRACASQCARRARRRPPNSTS